MALNQIYLLHPPEDRFPGIECWIEEVRVVLDSEVTWNGWALFTREYDNNHAIKVNDLVSLVNEIPGPVLAVEPIQRPVLEDLRGKLGSTAVVTTVKPGDPTDIYEQLTQIQKLHEDGEPLLPRKLIIALLVINKLENLRMWAGNAKGYLWAADVPKGRGVDEGFADQVPSVLSLLVTEGLLISKRSQGKTKFALNPDCRTDIYEILSNRAFAAGRFADILNRDRQQCSSRELDLIQNRNRPSR